MSRLGHIAFDCPNKKVIAFVEKEDPVYDHKDKDDGEFAYANQEMSIMVQRNLKVSCMVEEDNWIRTNVFHNKCITW